MNADREEGLFTSSVRDLSRADVAIAIDALMPADRSPNEDEQAALDRLVVRGLMTKHAFGDGLGTGTHWGPTQALISAFEPTLPVYGLAQNLLGWWDPTLEERGRADAAQIGDRFDVGALQFILGGVARKELRAAGVETEYALIGGAPPRFYENQRR